MQQDLKFAIGVFGMVAWVGVRPMVCDGRGDILPIGAFIYGRRGSLECRQTSTLRIFLDIPSFSSFLFSIQSFTSAWLQYTFFFFFPKENISLFYQSDRYLSKSPKTATMQFKTTFLILATAAFSSARIIHVVRQENAQVFTAALGGVEATPVNATRHPHILHFLSTIPF
jgi:hypothetical protein